MYKSEPPGGRETERDSVSARAGWRRERMSGDGTAGTPTLCSLRDVLVNVKRQDTSEAQLVPLSEAERLNFKLTSCNLYL